MDLEKLKTDQFVRGFRTYLGILVSVASDAFHISIRTTVSVIIFSFLGVFCNVAAILLLKELVSNDIGIVTPAEIFGLSIPKSFQFDFSLYPASAIILLVLFLAAILSYLSNVKALRLSINFEKMTTAKAMLAVSKTLREPDCELSKKEVRQLSKVATSYPRSLGRVMRSVIMLPQFFLQSLSLLIIMIPVNPLLTLLVMLVFFVAFLAQYLVNHRGAELSREFEFSGPRSNKRKRKVLESVVHRGIDSEDQVYREIDDEAISDNREKYFNRLKVLDESALISGLTIGIVVLVLLMSLSFYTAGEIEGYDWGNYISYIIMAVFFLRSTHGILHIITFISRYHHQTTRYYNLVSK